MKTFQFQSLCTLSQITCNGSGYPVKSCAVSNEFSPLPASSKVSPSHSITPTFSSSQWSQSPQSSSALKDDDTTIRVTTVATATAAKTTTTRTSTPSPTSKVEATPSSTAKSKPGNHNKPHSLEARRKISFSMLGQKRSPEMRAKVSEKMKGRVPWNKGKKLSKETRARMSAAASGRSSWNKGMPLSATHRAAISNASREAERQLSAETKAKMRMARRRPGDAVVSGNSKKDTSRLGSYRLVDSEDINAYIALRRELRTWSDNYAQHHSGKRPSMADIRRIAQVPIIRKFEKYIGMRERIRGLVGDVYGSVDPNAVPPVSTKDLVDSPVNNNHTRAVHITKHGNNRLVAPGDYDHDEEAPNVSYYSTSGDASLQGSVDDMFDVYDRPSIPNNGSATGGARALEKRLAKRDMDKIEADNTLIGAHVLTNGGFPVLDTAANTAAKGLSANDYRKIGRYRLLETMDINEYMKMRNKLQRWSASFKEVNGHVPSLTDARKFGQDLYAMFCDYLEMRDKMEGLVKEVYGTEVDDMETLYKLNAEGKQVLSTLTGNGSDSE